MNRKLILSAIFIASFFLVFLGMRNPDLSGGSAPKQRPRAVVENSTSKSVDFVKQLNFDIACALPTAGIIPKLCVLPLEVSPNVFSYSSIPPAGFTARAPPEFYS